MKDAFVLDATGLAPCWDRIDGELLRATVSGMLPGAATVTIAPGGVRQVPPPQSTAVREVGAAAFASIRTWLLGGPSPPPGPRTRRLPAAWRVAVGRIAPGRPFVPPDGAVVLKPDLRGWHDPVWQGWLGRHSGLRPVCFAHTLWGADFPEYLPAGEAAALQGSLAALARTARGLVVPTEVHREHLQTLLHRHGTAVPILVRMPPSWLADTDPQPFDAELAAAPYFVVPGTLDARSHVLLLLTLWRALVRDGRSVPKLVLAGARGRQVEELRPMLDWNETNRAHVREAPDLDAQGLRTLMAHARGVLAPSFAPDTGMVARDAFSLGAPVAASLTPVHAAVLGTGATLLDPIDGRGWRDAVLRMAEQPVLARRPSAMPDHASEWAALRSWLSRLP